MADLNLATRVDGEPCLVQREAVGVRTAANGDENAIGFDGFACAACSRFDSECCSSAFDARASNFRSGADAEALLLENFGCFFANFAVHVGQNLVKIFHNGNLRAKA